MPALGNNLPFEIVSVKSIGGALEEDADNSLRRIG
jgi:hypothetical protein